MLAGIQGKRRRAGKKGGREGWEQEGEGRKKRQVSTWTLKFRGLAGLSPPLPRDAQQVTSPLSAPVFPRAHNCYFSESL